MRPEKNEFVVSGNVKDWIFELARNGVVLIDGREGTLSDLRAGDDAVVTFERHGQQLLASAVRCTRKPNSSP